MPIRSVLVVAALMLPLAGTAWGDEQQIAPGTADQSAVVIDTGANGLCETTAAAGDIQAAPVGQGTPFRNEIRCGANKLVETAAANDDTQLVAVGSACKNANVVVVDTGPNGVADTTASGDDTQVITAGTSPAHTPCVITGGNGTADTGAAVGDDVLVLSPVGAAAPNTAVVLCGPNGIADTHANNDVSGGAGDDTQLIAVGTACSPTDVVVDSGADGVADTLAEGPDLVLTVPRPIKLQIGKGDPSAKKTIKVTVSNVEFGASAPSSRAYRLSVTKGSCPGGTINQVDADESTPTLDATASIPIGHRVKGSFVVQLDLSDVTTANSKAPFRCTINVDAIAVDTDPAVDDAANAENNSATVEVDVSDKNDL
jgi:hypothetical protein